MNPQDSTIDVAVCVGSSTAGTGPRIGSYHGELIFDSTHVSVVRIQRQGGGMRVENGALPGKVAFAGASPSGFESGPLLDVLLRVRGGALPTLRLRMPELNAVSGTDLTPTLAIATSAPCAPAGAHGAAPHLARLSPASISMTAVAAGQMIAVDVTGCGFDPTQNAVRFGQVSLSSIRSDGDGTHLRFVVPLQVPSSGEVPPQRIGPGSYVVVVVTPRGVSDSLSFTITLR
jgi:hypothetical protein